MHTKTCTGCHRDLPADRDHFYWSVRGIYLASQCIECTKELSAARNIQRSPQRQAVHRLANVISTWSRA